MPCFFLFLLFRWTSVHLISGQTGTNANLPNVSGNRDRHLVKIFGHILFFLFISLHVFSQPFNLADTNVKVGQFQHLYDIKFELGSANIILADVVQLDSLYQFLKNNPTVKIELGVHTDFRGDAKFNLELSKQRALSLQKYLADKGVTANRINPIGYGVTKPVIEYEDWRKLIDTHRCGYYGHSNRRVTIVVTSI